VRRFFGGRKKPFKFQVKAKTQGCERMTVRNPSPVDFIFATAQTLQFSTLDPGCQMISGSPSLPGAGASTGAAVAAGTGAAGGTAGTDTTGGAGAGIGGPVAPMGTATRAHPDPLFSCEPMYQPYTNDANYLPFYHTTMLSNILPTALFFLLYIYVYTYIFVLFM